MAQIDVLQWIGEHVWAPIGALVAVWWGMLQSRISKVEKKAEDALPRDEFERAHSESRADRDRLRGEIKELFSKNDATRELINAKVEAARERMSEDIAQLRKDMNSGFESIRNALLAGRDK